MQDMSDAPAGGAAAKAGEAALNAAVDALLPAARRQAQAHVLMYSHDTFGLGHLRRCRTIAHALVERFKGINVLIISGSPIAGAFEFRARVDFVKIPRVIKLYNGEYTSMGRHIDLHDTLDLRAAIIRRTAQFFEPDIFIVDKEPLGLRGELKPTLAYLKTRACALVLGLREVMDAPQILKKEWARENMTAKIAETYDHVWAYGPEDFWDPLTELGAPEALRRKLAFTGFLRRKAHARAPLAPGARDTRPLLVTAGGGGDGAQLMNQVIAAFEMDVALQRKVNMVLGPFMSAEERDAIRKRAAPHAMITLIDFDTRLETLMQSAAGIVSMGGYNTFCEILSFDKRALIVPRVNPREEQLIRATRAAELGLVDMLLPEQAEDPAQMAAALHRLATRPKPSQTGYKPSLDGLSRICDLVQAIMSEHQRPLVRRLAAVAAR